MKANNQGKMSEFPLPQAICMDKKRVEERHFGLSGQMPASDALQQLAAEGLERCLRTLPTGVDRAPYNERLRLELTDILDADFAPFFLVAHEAVEWTREQGIAMGPGYGSMCGSLLAWALGLTSIDPVRHGLLFERFFNRDRITLPDICLPCGKSRTSEIVAHMAAVYGEDAIRLLPSHEVPPNHDVVTLSIVGWPHLDVMARIPQALNTFALDDAATWAFVAQGASEDIFLAQMPYLCGFLRKAQPSCLEELAAILALCRPAPIEAGLLETFILNGKIGGVSNSGPACVQGFLQKTRGVLVYQEQVMEIVHSMAGFTLGYADIVRRLLTRKNPAVVEREKEMFLAGADKHGIAKSDALAVFGMLASGAQYCYSRSAAVAEALFMYQTAWCRVHNQEAYVAACKEVF